MTIGFALIWLEMLAIAVLLMTIGTGIFSRIQSSLLKYTFALVTLLALVDYLGEKLLALNYALKTGLLPSAVFYSAFSLVLAIAVIGMACMVKFRRISLLRLSFVLALSIASYMGTAYHVDRMLAADSLQMVEEITDKAMEGFDSAYHESQNSYPLYESLLSEKFSEAERKLLDPYYAGGVPQHLNAFSTETKALLDRRSYILATLREASLRPEFHPPMSFDPSEQELLFNSVLWLTSFCGLSATNLAENGQLDEAIAMLEDLDTFATRSIIAVGGGMGYGSVMITRARIMQYYEDVLFKASAQKDGWIPSDSGLILNQSLELDNVLDVELASQVHQILPPFTGVEVLSDYLKPQAGAHEINVGFQYIVNYQTHSIRKYFEDLKEIVSMPCTEIRSKSEIFFNNDNKYALGIALNSRSQDIITFKCQALTNRAIVELSTGVMAYKAQHGRFPSRVEDLVPEFLPAIPQDPLTESPLDIDFVDGGLTIKPSNPDDSPYIQDFHMGVAYEKYRVETANESKKAN